MSNISARIRGKIQKARQERLTDSETQPVPKSLKPSSVTSTVTMIVLIVAAIYFLLPIWWLIIQSTKSYDQMISTPALWFGHTFDFVKNFKDMTSYDGGYFPRWLGNSLIYSCATAFIGTIVALACGYAFSKFRFPYKRVLFGLIMVGMLLPASLLTIPMFYFFNSLHLTDTMWAVIIPCSVSPFGVFLAMIYCQTVPDELLEEARIDGASELRIFFTIVMRILAPAVVTIALFIFVATWNDFLLPLVMLRDKSLLPVTLGLYTWQNTTTDNLTSQVLTGSLISVLPVIVLFLLLQRYWRSGLTQGSVKS